MRGGICGLDLSTLLVYYIESCQIEDNQSIQPKRMIISPKLSDLIKLLSAPVLQKFKQHRLV